MDQAHLKYANVLVWVTLSLGVYSVLYAYFKVNQQATISGILSLLGESGLDLIGVGLAYVAYKATENNLRIFFLLIFTSLFAAFISDISYNIILNIKQIGMNNSTNALFDIPFIVFLFLQMLAWIVLFKSEKHPRNIIDYLPYSVASIVIAVTFMFGINWKIPYFSQLGIYQVVDTLFEAVGLLFASFCLIRAKRLWVKHLSIGYLVVIAADFSIRYGVVQNKIAIANPAEIVWVVGLAIMVMGFFLSRREVKRLY